MSQFSVLDLSTDDSTLVLTAVYEASPERIFAAWLDPAAITRWIRPSPECTVEVLRYDTRVGGEYSVLMTLDEGVFGYGGVFTVIDPPHRLEMTWLWAPTPEDAYPETYLVVEIEPTDDGTRLTLTHSRIRSIESRDSHSEGWSATLTELAEYLKTP